MVESENRILAKLQSPLPDYEVRSDVFLPAGTVESYLDRLYEDKNTLTELSREVSRLLIQFGG